MNPPWYERSFGKDYLLVYKHRDYESAAVEVHSIMNFLKMSKCSKILDLCCGMGRHSLALAEQGYEVTGVDLSTVLLKQAREKDIHHRVTWCQSDMRKLSLAGEFDAVLNLFTSFGYFVKDEENMKVLRQIYMMLRDKGQFVIDFLNPVHVINTLLPYSKKEYKNQQIEEIRNIQDGFVIKQITITDVLTGNKRTYEERVKLYERHTLTQMIERAGLTISNVFGTYSGQPYEKETSTRMIFVGER